MKVRFLVLFLLISAIQPIISTTDFNMNFTSEGKALIQSNGQTQQLLGKLYGSIEDSIRLKNKAEETKGEYKEEVLNITRKSQGGGSSGGSGSRGKTGTGGTADVNRRPHTSSAPSQTLFWVSIFFNPCLSLALLILFSFHLV